MGWRDTALDWKDIAERAISTFWQAAAGIIVAAVMAKYVNGEDIVITSNDIWAAVAMGFAAVFSVGKNVVRQKRGS